MWASIHPLADQKISANNLDQRAPPPMGLTVRAHAEVFLLPSLIFLGVAGDRTSTFVDIDIDVADPEKRARELLAEHRSCDRVEVWRDERCIGVIARDRSDPVL
jgi:hypothetical protein